MDTLLHFSGGQDSTYVLYQWLKNNPNQKLLVHHINLHHPAEPRSTGEKIAVKNILNWLKKNGLNNFVYYESSFDYGTLPRIAIKDIQIVALFSGIILKTPQFSSIKKILLPWHKGEVNDASIRRGYRVMDMLFGLDIPSDTYELLFPIEFMERQDMAKDMPTDLLKLCHCCRKPLSNGKNCGKCRPCKQLKSANLFNIVNA